MIHPTKNSVIPSDLDLSPSLIEYKFHQNHDTSVDISNVTTRTVNIQPHALLCEIQPISIQDNIGSENLEFTPPLLEQVKVSIDNLTTQELEKGKQLIRDYSDIFSKGDSDMGHTTIVQHKI